MKVFNKVSSFIIKATVVTTLATASINYVVDPYGAFGDKFLKMYKFDLVNNQKILKTEYLEKNYRKFNTFVMGGSKANGLLPDKVDAAFADEDAHTFLLNTNSGEFSYYEKEIDYAIKHYDVKRVVLQLSVLEMQYYGDFNRIGRQFNYKVDGIDSNSFYYQFLNIDLNESIDKIKATKHMEKYTAKEPWPGTYISEAQSADVIRKHGREYYTRSSNTFNNEPRVNPLVALDDNLKALSRIVENCKRNNVKFTLISAPTSNKEMLKYDINQMKDYMIKIADICPYWNFTGYNDYSWNYWNFYNTTHYRKEVGTVMLSKISGKKLGKVKLKDIPDNFGKYITPANAKEELDKAFTKPDYLLQDDLKAEGEREYKYGMKFGPDIWDKGLE